MTLKEKTVLWESKDVSLMELSDLPVRGNEVVPINQHTAVRSDLADLLGARVCGPSCVAMALQTFDKYPKEKHLGNIEWLLAAVTPMHKSDGEMINLRIEIDSKNVEVPVDMNSEVNRWMLDDSRFVITPGSGKYEPVFSMARGWDHRGSARFFESFGLKAGFWNKVDAEELKLKLKEGGVVILSVIPRRLSSSIKLDYEVNTKPAHLVLITDVLEINGKPYFLVTDPDFDISEGVMPRYLINEDQLSKISNWRGTWVMEK